MNAYQKIKQAMKANEREVLKRIRATNKQGEPWSYVVLGPSWHSALDRLIASGKVSFQEKNGRRGYFAKREGKK